MQQKIKHQGQSNEAALICDFSLNDLKMLMSAQEDETNHDQFYQMSESSPQKTGLSPEKYNQLTKLDDEEENVNFMDMFNQFQKYRGQQSNPQVYTEGGQLQAPNEHQMYDQNYQLEQIQSHSVNIQQRPVLGGKQKSKGVRPSSANVGGQQTRFLQGQPNSNTNKQKSIQHGGSMGGPNFNDHYKNQQLVNPSIKQLTNQQNTQQISYRNNNIISGMFNSASMKPPIFKSKKTRPVSAAKNQLKPSKELSSVTQFTFQKAKRNENQRQFVPESLKNTDKERLYEDKINLKKQLNEIMQENQILRTQVQTQANLVKKKDDTIQNMLLQMFQGQIQNQNDNFLDEFQRREIQHDMPSKPMKAKPSSKAPNSVSQKDNTIIVLKQKLKDVNEMLRNSQKELQDLKSTLKFTKIQEFERELALNVQESQRLRNLLEKEIQRQKIDPRLIFGLKQQITQYQQIIQNLQANQQVVQQDNESLNKKHIMQQRKIDKLKELKRRANEKNVRLEKKVQMLQNKLLNAPDPAILGRKASDPQSNSSVVNSQQFQQMHNQFQTELNNQADLINSLLKRLEDCGFPVSDQELMQMQMQIQQQAQQLHNIVEEDEEDISGDKKNSLLNFQILFKPTNDQRKIQDTRFESFDQLQTQVAQMFDLADQKDLNIKIDLQGEDVVLQKDNFEQILENLNSDSLVNLVVNLGDTPHVEEVEGEYEEDEFEKNEESEHIEWNMVTKEDLKVRFQELKCILQIKNIKKGDILKYLLHGEKQQNGKKIKKVSIKTLAEKIHSRIGFEKDQALLMARFFIEKPVNGQDKITVTKDYETKTQILRKNLHQAIQENVQDYILYNGLLLTNLLGRVHNIFDEYKVELETELEDRDEDDKGTTSIEELYKSMKIIGIMVGNFDEDIKEFIQFLAMRHSKSLDEVKYKEFINALNEDFTIVEDKVSRWNKGENGEEQASAFEPSSEEDEMESAESPIAKSVELNDKIVHSRTPSNLNEFHQNILLEKVDEILMQVVRALPEHHKIKTLTQAMMPYLHPIEDDQTKQQFLIISQEDFITFLMGQEPNQLGLDLEETHIICLLHLLVQETEEDNKDSEISFILFDEFIELVKTYMKKELIMQQSKNIGINYDILSKESVEILFQIRSCLMQEDNINDESENEERNQKPVGQLIREIFDNIITTKNIRFKKEDGLQTVEMMDFEQMLDAIRSKMGINYPSYKAQEELKFLLCLDFKYLEMIMMVKFDKVMHDLDYISIDLLRQAQDHSLDEQRKMNLNQLRRLRDKQLVQLKGNDGNFIKEEISERIHSANNGQRQLYQGVSQSSHNDKKRKRPDDKHKKVVKNVRSKPEQEYELLNQKLQTNQNNRVASAGHPASKALKGNVINLKTETNFDDMNVNDSDINRKTRKEISDDDDEYYSQDDIPIDVDEDEDDGIISDNFIQENKRTTNVMKSESKEMEDEEEAIMSMGQSDDMVDIRKTRDIEDEEEDKYDASGNVGYSIPDSKHQQLMDEVINDMQDNYDEDMEYEENDEEMQPEMEDEESYQVDKSARDNEQEIEDNYPDESEESANQQQFNQQQNFRGLTNTKSGLIAVKHELPVESEEEVLKSGNKNNQFILNQSSRQQLEDEEEYEEGVMDDEYDRRQFEQPSNRKSEMKSLNQSQKSKRSQKFAEAFKEVSEINDQYSEKYSKQDRSNQQSSKASERYVIHDEFAAQSSRRSEVLPKSQASSKNSRMENQAPFNALKKAESRHSEQYPDFPDEVPSLRSSKRSDAKQQVLKEESKYSEKYPNEMPSQRSSKRSLIPKSQTSSKYSLKPLPQHQPSSQKEESKSYSERYTPDESQRSSKRNVILPKLPMKEASRHSEQYPDFPDEVPSHKSSKRSEFNSSVKQSAKQIAQIPQFLNEDSRYSENYPVEQVSQKSSKRSEVVPKSSTSSKYKAVQLAQNVGFNKEKSRQSEQKSSQQYSVQEEAYDPNQIDNSYPEEMPSQRSSKMKFNPSIHSSKYSQMSRSIKSKHSAKMSEKLSSKKSSQNKKFTVQGNLFGNEDSSEQYEEEEEFEENQIEQDIQAGASEIEDFAVEVPSNRNEPLPNMFQKRQISGMEQSLPKSGMSKKSKRQQEQYVEDFEDNNVQSQRSSQQSGRRLKKGVDFYQKQSDSDDYEF